MRKRTSKMESTRKIVKNSVFFFFFGQRRWSTPEVNAGGQRADVARADVARVGRVARGAWDTWGAWARGSVARGARESAWERVERVGAHGRTSGGTWGRVGPCLESQKLLAARGGAYEVRSGRFWSQWTDRDEIYPMKVVLRQTETWR